MEIHFAPLQGFTECAYRQAHFLYASSAFEESAGKGTAEKKDAKLECLKIAAYYTPFLRVEKNEVRSKDLRDLEQDMNFMKQHPNYRVIPQVICKNAREFKILVSAICQLNDHTENANHTYFPQIDINMGCPFPMQAKSGRGSGLLPQMDAVKEILAKISEINNELVETHAKETPLKFSIKMRLGYTDPSDCLRLLPLINDVPLTHVTMHPRLGIQQYKGALDLEAFRPFYEGCRHPLLFNGNIQSVQDMETLAKEFPNLNGFMVGRGFLANPTFENPYPLETLQKIHTYILNDYRKRLQGDSQVLDKIRPFWTYVPLEKRSAKKIAKTRNLSEYLDAVKEIHLFSANPLFF